MNINKMVFPDTEKEYDIRLKGKLVLKTVLNQDTNIKIVEKYIHKKSLKNEDYDDTYIKILYQTVGDILNGKDLKIMINDIKKNMIGWNHTIFTDIKNRIEEHDEFIINPFEVEEGVTTCHCGSGRVFTYQKQTRGADEPMTTFAECVKCKAKWKYSG
jgi:DNA-directed RNA polymerase subunit M/transcription elongation factor TFIIS